jgi:hypothetical protein
MLSIIDRPKLIISCQYVDIIGLRFDHRIKTEFTRNPKNIDYSRKFLALILKN